MQYIIFVTLDLKERARNSSPLNLDIFCVIKDDWGDFLTKWNDILLLTWGGKYGFMFPGDWLICQLQLG